MFPTGRWRTTRGSTGCWGCLRQGCAASTLPTIAPRLRGSFAATSIVFFLFRFHSLWWVWWGTIIVLGYIYPKLRLLCDFLCWTHEYLLRVVNYRQAKVRQTIYIYLWRPKKPLRSFRKDLQKSIGQCKLQYELILRYRKPLGHKELSVPNLSTC